MRGLAVLLLLQAAVMVVKANVLMLLNMAASAVADVPAFGLYFWLLVLLGVKVFTIGVYAAEWDVPQADFDD